MGGWVTVITVSIVEVKLVKRGWSRKVIGVMMNLGLLMVWTGGQ